MFFLDEAASISAVPRTAVIAAVSRTVVAAAAAGGLSPISGSDAARGFYLGVAAPSAAAASMPRVVAVLHGGGRVPSVERRSSEGGGRGSVGGMEGSVGQRIHDSQNILLVVYGRAADEMTGG
mmetsp:Transcript_38367/g.92526  ORF Transcript_38367/g.92526 Transcript_38367/m.92526 type:complete len:123 (-) Transcript_38367:35-403(-)